jgi:hypothetical protein
LYVLVPRIVFREAVKILQRLPFSSIMSVNSSVLSSWLL